MTTRRIIKAAGLVGMVAGVLAAAPANACLIIVGGPPPPGSLIVVEFDFLAADETPPPGSGMAARIKRLMESAVPGEMPILRLPRVPPRSPCGRHFGYAPGPLPIGLVHGATASGPPEADSGSLVEFISPPREGEFRVTLGGRIPEE